MRFSELRPEFGAMSGLPGRFWLTFDCQVAKGQRVYVQFHRGPQEPGVWQCTSWLGAQPDMENLTLLPSIGGHTHGRSWRCQGHVTLRDGNVLP